MEEEIDNSHAERLLYPRRRSTSHFGLDGIDAFRAVKASFMELIYAFPFHYRSEHLPKQPGEGKTPGRGTLPQIG